jgi:hypothetical protein
MSPSRCCHGHLLREVGYRVVGRRIVCLECARNHASRHRKVVKRMPDTASVYADAHAPSEAECARKAALIHAMLSGESGYRSVDRVPQLVRMGA